MIEAIMLLSVIVACLFVWAFWADGERRSLKERVSALEQRVEVLSDALGKGNGKVRSMWGSH